MRGHIAGSSPLYPLRFEPCIFNRVKTLALSFLVDSRRIVRTHTLGTQQLSFLSLQINSKSRHGGIRTHRPTLVGIRGLPLVRRGHLLYEIQQLQSTIRALLLLVAHISIYTCGVPGGLVGRLSSCLLKSISRVQFSPSAHTCRDFFSDEKNDKRKARHRELATFGENRRALGMLNPMPDKI